MLLKTYYLRLGKSKYWILVTISIVYFIFPFLFDDLGIFDDLRMEYGRQFNLVYNIFFSLYRLVGGLLSGIVFFMTAMKIKRKDLRGLVTCSGIGMTLLFGSTVIHGLSYILAPPYGLITLIWISQCPCPSASLISHMCNYGNNFSEVIFFFNWGICSRNR